MLFLLFQATGACRGASELAWQGLGLGQPLGALFALELGLGLELLRLELLRLALEQGLGLTLSARHGDQLWLVEAWREALGHRLDWPGLGLGLELPLGLGLRLGLRPGLGSGLGPGPCLGPGRGFGGALVGFDVTGDLEALFARRVLHDALSASFVHIPVGSLHGSVRQSDLLPEALTRGSASGIIAELWPGVKGRRGGDGEVEVERRRVSRFAAKQTAA